MYYLCNTYINNLLLVKKTFLDASIMYRMFHRKLLIIKFI